MKKFMQKFISLFAQGMINGMPLTVGGDMTKNYIF